MEGNHFDYVVWKNSPPIEFNLNIEETFKNWKNVVPLLTILSTIIDNRRGHANIFKGDGSFKYHDDIHTDFQHKYPRTRTVKRIGIKIWLIWTNDP